MWVRCGMAAGVAPGFVSAVQATAQDQMPSKQVSAESARKVCLEWIECSQDLQ